MKRGFVNTYQSVEKKSDEKEDGSVVLREKAVFGGFLSLLPEVVVDIITNLLDLDQLIRFSVVSRYWNNLSSLPLHGNPWLIVPSIQSTSKFDCTCDATIGFFSPLSGKVYKLAVPQKKDHRICGSCPGGWLITVHAQGEIQILHPFSKAVISLPPSFELHGIGSEWNRTVRYDAMLGDARRELPAADIIRDAYIYKAVMSSTNPKFSVVMSIQGFPRKLVFCRVDENKRSYKRSLCGRDGISSYKKRWNLVKGNENEGISDVTFYCGQFYAIRNSGGVFVVEGWHFPSPYIKFVIDCPPYPMAFTKYYLVELLGELLCVMRFRFRSPEKPESPIPLTTFFKVSKLDWSGPKWIDVHNLGEDHALFIGFNQSFSFTISDCQGFKGNSIFFGDDNYMENHQGEPFGGYDIGVFNMTRGIVEKCYPNVATPIMPPPIWFTTHAGQTRQDRQSQVMLENMQYQSQENNEAQIEIDRLLDDPNTSLSQLLEQVSNNQGYSQPPMHNSTESHIGVQGFAQYSQSFGSSSQGPLGSNSFAPRNYFEWHPLSTNFPSNMQSGVGSSGSRQVPLNQGWSQQSSSIHPHSNIVRRMQQEHRDVSLNHQPLLTQLSQQQSNASSQSSVMSRDFGLSSLNERFLK